MIILMAMDTDEDFRAIAKKLHTQFAHPKPDKLIKLLKDGGTWPQIFNKGGEGSVRQVSHMY